MILAREYEQVRSKRPPGLFARLRANVCAEALEASRILTVDLIEATVGAPDLHRRARLIVMLYLAAVTAQADGERRERRWRRFINALSPVAEQTRSMRLLALVHENGDLLEQKNVANFV